MTDALYIASGKTEPFGEALEKQVEVGRAGAEFNIFPMARQTAAWKLGFKVRFPNSEADGYMMLREGVAAGQTIDLERQMGTDFQDRQQCQLRSHRHKSYSRYILYIPCKTA